MNTPVLWPNRAGSSAFSLSFTEDFDAGEQLRRRVLATGEYGATTVHEGSSLTSHTLHEFEAFVLDTLPVLVTRCPHDGNAAETIIVVRRIFIVNSKLQSESPGGDISHNSRRLPFWIP